jgi:DNA repair protein RecO (recombination protein O)
MDTHISSAIIMRVKEFGESDLLVTFFTADMGRLKGVAKGARRSRRRFANCLDLFCLANLEYETKPRGSLHFLHSCKLVDAFEGIRANFSSLSLASYMIELTEVLFPLGVVDKAMFELLKHSFFALNKGRKNDLIRMLFEVKGMALGGYGVNLEKCCRCGRPYGGEGRAVFIPGKGAIACLKCTRESRLSPGMSPDSVSAFHLMQSAPWSKLEPVSFPDEPMREIKAVLKLHIEYRIGRRLKSADYLG